MTRLSFLFDSARARFLAAIVTIMASAAALGALVLDYSPVAQAAIVVSMIAGAFSLVDCCKNQNKAELQANAYLAVIAKISSVCSEISKGNFEARIPQIIEVGIFADVQHNVNDMIDRCDAFIREATASLQAVCQNVYYRRIILGGMSGSFRVAAETINNAVRTLEQAVEKARRDAMLEHSKVISALSRGLNSLAKGDLTCRLDDLPKAFAELKTNYNMAADDLEGALARVKQIAVAVQDQAHEISTASNELSQRTERQAAMLEQSTAAMQELVDAVNRTAGSSTKTKDAISAAKEDTSGSIEVVQKTIQAIERIRSTSANIAAIIGVIDEIAFQTNLLALNAGVEAARAGSAGSGFAVVASEVRSLAQRSAEAAKQIKGLITQCSTEVANGVELVDATGRAFDRIKSQIGNIDGGIAHIAGQAIDQARTIKEVNATLGEMDTSTQQNAAMADQATAACRSLADESKQLADMLSRFAFRDAELQSQSTDDAAITRGSQVAA
jgi:methyl-accepting chemotaxis protein